MKLWCFGDSNTYGYDPCGFFGGRYAAPGPELLAGKSGPPGIHDGGDGGGNGVSPGGAPATPTRPPVSSPPRPAPTACASSVSREKPLPPSTSR